MTRPHAPERAAALLAPLAATVDALGDDALAELELRAAGVDFLGLQIAAPPAVDLDARDRLPVLMLSRTTGQRDWEVLLARNAVLVAFDLQTGRTGAAWAFPTGKRINVDRLPTSRSGPPPTPEDADAITIAAKLLDARAVLDLPWHAGRVALTLLQFDWPSNTVTVELRGREPVDPGRFSTARAEALAAVARDGRFRRTDASPPLAGPGVALSVPTSVAADDARCPIHLSVRMPAPPAALLDYHDPVTASLPPAVLTVALLVVRLDELAPAMIPVEIPVLLDAELEPYALVEGFAVVDLFALGLRDAVLAGDTLLYAVAGEFLAGPHPLPTRGADAP